MAGRRGRLTALVGAGLNIARRLGRRRPEQAPAPLPTPVWATPHGPAPPPAGWRAAALALPDGAPLGDTLAEALRAEIEVRARTCVADWPAPHVSELVVRHADRPDCWREGGNLLLLAPGVPVPNLGMSPGDPPTGGVAAVGARSTVREIILGGSNAFLAIGDDATLTYVNVQVSDGTVVLGEQTGATFVLQLDARNGGAILIGDDTIMGAATRIITDDMHAIRDRATGARINRRGGRIAIGRHVWIGEQVLIGGETVIGEDSVLGTQSMTKGRVLPAHSVCLGRPARVARTGTTWTRADDP